MHAVAFLTTELGAHYVTDDHLAVPHLRKRGVEVSFVPWRRAAEWSAFDLVVVRSTWDYQRALDPFLETLARIGAATRLENPLPFHHWNVRKTYLRDLAAAGIPVVPTAWRTALRPPMLQELFEELRTDEVVLKPVVGSSGEDAFRIRRRSAGDVEGRVLEVFRDKPLMAQPFLPGVLDRGELSVVWIDGRASHGIRKVPRPGEFRSQEEHGGRVEAVQVGGALAAAADRVARLVAARFPATPLYGRVDFLPGRDGLLVGELELVEPSLYLRLDSEAPLRLAAAILKRLAQVV